jgi:hypothetical protein
MLIQIINLLLFVWVFVMCLLILFKIKSIRSKIDELNAWIYHPSRVVTQELKE